MYNTQMGIDDNNLKTSIEALQQILCDEYVLANKTRSYHWNIVGSNFSQYHELFESQYQQIEKSIDEIAERIRILGSLVRASLAYYLRYTSLKEDTEIHYKPEVMCKSLLIDQEILIRSLRDKITMLENSNDFGTIDFLTRLLQDHEKMAWFLRTHIIQAL